MASISVSFDSKSSTVPASVTDPSSPHFDDEEKFYDYLRGTEAMDDDTLRFFGTCEKQIFDDFGNQNNIYFPPFENTKPIVSAHKKIWRAGHTRDISKLLLGTEDEKVSYVSGLLVTAITLFVCFLIWMIVLIILKILGRDKVGFLSGHRSKLPLKQEGPSLDSKSKEETKPETAAGGGDEGKHDEGEKDDADKVTSNDASCTINKTDEEQEERTDTGTQEQKSQNQVMSSSDEEWNELYANKKKEEWWMKSFVLIACIVIILMSGTMAQKGVQSLQKSLEDGIISINYAGDLLTKAEVAVGELADGLASFQTDVLDILERTNTGLCPRFKPEGFCQREFEVQSCDFTIQVNYERDIEIDKLGVNTTIDASYNYTVDISEVADNMKDKIGSDERLNLAEVLFPTSPTIYPSLIGFFSRNWTSVDKLSDFAAKINSFATMASETGDRIETLEWVFYLAVAFNIIVGLLAMYMIVHVCVGQKFPSYLKCVQPRVLFPFFIICVSLAFIFATVFLITSMALSDTCVDDPNKRILSMVKDYMGDGLAADYVTDFVQHWFSRCNKEPVSMQKDQAFLNNAQQILQQFDGAMNNITESVIDFCETTDTELFIDMTATSMKFLCGVLGLTVDVREVFQCKTWMPLYYNTMYNVVCYNGIDGMWTIAATQLTTVLMACIVLTFRAVFFDIEPMESDDENEEVVDSVDALDDQIQNDGEC